MHGIRERYERAFIQREDRSEESGGDRDRDGKGDDDGHINLVVRREGKYQEEEDQERSMSEAQANANVVEEGKEEQGIATNTTTAAEERGEEWNIWVTGEDTFPPPPCSKISNLPTDDPSLTLAVISVLCDDENGDDNHEDEK